MRLPLGKLPLPILEKYVLKRRGRESPNCIVGPGPGIDFSVIKLNKRYLIVSSDPITGAEKDVGWLAVNVSANDVATSGARPQYASSIILFPENSDIEMIDTITQQIDRAAKSLGISIVSGHSEITPRLDRPIIIMTTFSITDRYVTAKDARVGDCILMTKSAGIEGTSILAETFKDKLAQIDKNSLIKASKMIEKISIVKEAVRAFATGCVHAMHDPTEGG
ncbi:MAG: AIR synthase related protein, partial [Nitrososphaerales archaeon]|nr:AIR synthase related protein [Nitrososphaerales archaeon]